MDKECLRTLRFVREQVTNYMMRTGISKEYTEVKGYNLIKKSQFVSRIVIGNII